MSEQNCITLYDDYIELSGFDEATSRITFCFYDNCVVISPIERTGQPYYFTTDLDENKISKDRQIIDILKRDRKFTEKTYFFFSGDSYMEINPHKSTL